MICVPETLSIKYFHTSAYKIADFQMKISWFSEIVARLGETAGQNMRQQKTVRDRSEIIPR